MVLFATSSNPKYVIYLGKDKYENEELIKYGFPIDVWFHVEHLSSAHVYLRLPDGVDIDSIPKDVLDECCQLVKDGSKEGRKKETVSVCYTMWDNLKKTNAMEVGEVGFKDQSKVRVVTGIAKNNDVLKTLKKTIQEKTVDYAAEKESYNVEMANRRKKQLDEEKRKLQEEIKKQKELKKEMRFEYIDELGEATTNKDNVDLEDDFW
jgi:hypothetical protein